MDGATPHPLHIGLPLNPYRKWACAAYLHKEAYCSTPSQTENHKRVKNFEIEEEPLLMVRLRFHILVLIIINQR